MEIVKPMIADLVSETTKNALRVSDEVWNDGEASSAKKSGFTGHVQRTFLAPLKF